MKKEATPKHKGLKSKTSDKKKSKPQNARGSNQRPPMKKEATPNTQGAQIKDLQCKKRGNANRQGDENQEPLAHQSQLYQTNT
jgi:hypothetical protein